MTVNKSLIDVPGSSVADLVDSMVFNRGGVVMQVPLSKLPISDEVAAKLAEILSQIAPSASAPIAKVAPVLSTSTPTINITLSATMPSGANLIDGVGGSHKWLVQWWGTPVGGTKVALGAPITLGTGVIVASLLMAYPTHLGLQISIDATPVDVTGATGNRLTSALTSAVTNTPPTYVGGVLPSVTPTGTQASGTVLTALFGTLLGGNGGAVFSAQWQFMPAGGAFADIPLAIGVSYTIQDGQKGGTLRIVVTPVSAQGPGAPGVSSNSVTVSGSATIVSTVAPSLAGTLTQGVADAINVGTYTGGTIDPTCVYLIYCQEGPGGLTTPILTYGVLPNGGATFTPPDDASFLALTGLSTPVGKHFAVKMRATIGGVGPFDSLLSTPVVCVAVSTTLLLNVALPSISLTMGTAFGAVSPITIAQGVGPFSYKVLSALPPGTLYSVTAPTVGVFNGNPVNTGSPTPQTYQVTVQVTDAGNGGATANATFTVIVSPVSVSIPLLSQMYGDQTPSQWVGAGYELQMLGGDIDAANYQTGSGNKGISGTFDSAGVHGTGNITGPTGVGSSTLRFGVVADPVTPSRNVLYYAAKSSDPTTFGHLGRVETVHPQAGGGAIAKTGTTYWFASEMYLPTVRWTNGSGSNTICQLHNNNPSSISTGPWELSGDLTGGNILPNASIYLSRIFQFLNNNGSGGAYVPGSTIPAGGGFVETYPFISDNSTFTGSAATDNLTQAWGALYSGGSAAVWPKDKWVKLLVKYHGDPVGAGSGSGLGTGVGTLQAWIQVGSVVTQIANFTNVGIGTNDAPAGYPTDYFKDGLDEEGGGGAGVWECRRSTTTLIDQGYTATQLFASTVVFP